MAETRDIINTGLRGVTVASTRISNVDGEAGKLIYRGYPIQDLAENATFEEIVHLLLYEKLPTNQELDSLQQSLIEERAVPQEIIEALKTRPRDSQPMDILQAAPPMLANHDPEARTLTEENARDIGIKLIAKFPTVVAAWQRLRHDRAPVDPDPELGHAANFLYMLTGTRPDEEIARFLDICLILHADHTFNASTFAAREVCSTRAHMYSAVAAAVGSLSGELHGGANARVMQTLLDIGSPEAVEDYVTRLLDQGGKIMGLGHAVYKTLDPRARILDPISRRLGERINDSTWYQVTKKLEEKGREAFQKRKGKDIYPNVDFFSASVYYCLGIPIDLFTPVFAISRVSGWAAHVIEEQYAEAAPKPVLYRPSAEYVGEYCGPEECAFVPMDQRK
ncbi:MAG: citrate synthase [Desulfohalobiaceae bacterium]|nr:citrate synthase [Desulfohalobiaceae bacterium]